MGQKPLLEPRVECGILGPDGAGFEAAGEEGAVGVSNDRVDEGGGGVGLGAEEGFGPFEGFVVPVAGEEVGGEFVGVDDEVFADDDANVFDFKSLAGVNAADLVNGVGVGNPGGAVLGEVPLFGEVVVGEDDVCGSGVLFGAPRVAVAGDDAGGLAGSVEVVDFLKEFRGG